ncbi:hypothetical protein ACKWTF_014145 [Chironomus riparius]
MSYQRSFNVNKKLWTAVVKTMNGYTADENGWVEYYVSRNDESDIKQVTSYYDSDKKLLKSETKIDEKSNTTGKDFSDNLLYDESGKLQVANIFPYKMSEDAFGYCGFEDYERTDNWTFDKHKVIKNGFALTGKNYLRLERGEKFEKSFIPKNKEEIFTAAAWIRSKALNINQPTGNFKAIISYSVNGKDFKELYGILGKITSKSGEWLYAEISIDILTFIRGSYNNHKLQNPNLPAFEVVDIKITLTAFGPDLDIDNVAFYPAPHHLSINVYNSNRDATAAIHNEGQITRIYYDSITLKEIGRTKKNGKLEQFLVRSEGEKDSPKVVTKFSLSSGFHETFDNFMFASIWKINNERNWKVFPSELMYENDNSDGTIEVRDEKVMDAKSAAIRLEVSLDSNKTSKFELKFASDSIKFISNGRNQAELNVNNQKVADIPQHFELAVFKYLNRTILWINGIIMLDEMQIDTWKDFTINCLGTVAIRDLFILNNPKIEVFYHNSFDEQQQVIKFVSENSAVITQYIYDKYGREIVKSKPTKVTKSSSEPLLKFHKNFIKSFDEQTSKIEGNVVAENPVDNGYPFFHTKYLKNPLNEKQKIGQPGHDYSINSNFSTTYSKDIDIPFLTAYFPEGEGFTTHAENLSNGSIRVLVLDKNGNKVAKYVQVPNFDDIFMTFEHDLDGRVVKVLSPKYHEAAETLYSIDKTYKIGDAHLTEDEKELQNQLCSHYKYDKNGNAIEKQTPDTGRQVFLYNSMNLLKFSITYNADPKDGQTIYYNYDSAGLLTETGHITRPVSVEYLKKFVDSNFHTEAIEFQKIQFNEGKSKIIETINHDTTVLEEIQFDENEEDKIVSRKMTVPAITESLQTSFNLQRLYNGDHVEVLTYPTTDEGKILKVKHTYNAVGQLIGIGTVEKPFCFAKFTYDANGQPTSEIHELNNLNRKYSYNSPGYMNKIDDEFMSEDISYIDGGYGQLGYGDGIVMKTAYNAKWSDEYFKKNEQGKNDDDYGDGILEEDEEANLRLENQKNLNSIKIATVNQLRNRIIQERYPSSSEDSVENSIENRRKRQTSFISAQETTKSMGSHSDIQPRPKQLKLEDILGKFKGFAVDGLRVKHFKNPGSIHEASSDPEANTTKRIKRNFNIQNEATSRQSKINKILTNPGIDSCITSLKDTTFITKNDLKFSKILNTNAEVNLPLKCFDNKIYDEISARHQIPKNYGHRYTYGTHRELVKSKYFSTKAEEEAEPLQMNTFNEKMSGIDFYRSHNIFNVLRDGNFIAVDRRRKDKKSSIGTKGTTALIREDDLNQLLDKLGSDYVDLFPVVQQLILHTIANKKILEYSDFEKMFLNWKSASTNTVKIQLDKFKRNAKTLFDSLTREALLPTSLETFISPLNKKLIFDLKRYEKSQIVEIVGILSKSFNYELLTTAFDTASYEIDANGNHKKFSTGFDSVKLDYHENTSKLKTLEVKGKQYTVDHDGYGNMTSAPHKGVKKIIYHPVSRRVMEVLLTNGGSIKFHYNSQGERILKQVYDSKYEITKEILYIRDEDGNVLMDRVMNFDQKDKTCYEVVTHYIYGPRGIIGFIRDDKFHSIFTDHSGSVRLVIRDGKVVASYDYLPYGEMMRKFISDDTADIRYLYHGKELDVEIDMYNYHARFYDPTIGRFLQTDPQSQYFSPYKFSGNSPVSFVDPDGEFSILLALGFGILGAYLSTAAHNKSWNPGKWDFADPGTYLSMFTGALTGAFLPSGVGEVIGTLYYVATPAAMAFTAYISAAAANGNWNPAEWKFNSPETYSAIFFGLSAGVSSVKGVLKIAEFAKTLSIGGKVVLFGFSGTSALGAFYVTGLEQNEGNKNVFQWNFLSPVTWKAIMDGFTLGLSIGINFNTLRKDIESFTKNPKALKEFFKNLTPKNIHNMKTIFANREHPFYVFLGSVGFGYLMGSSKNKDFNPLNWKNNVGTYASIMSGMITGKNLVKSLAVLTTGDVKAAASSEWKDLKGIGTGIKRQFLTLERKMIRFGHKTYVRIEAKFSKSSIDERSGHLDRTLSEELEDQWLMTAPDKIAFTDRQTSSLTPCGSRRRKRTIQGGICQSLRTNWNTVRDVFTRRDMNAVFENTAIISQIPGIMNSDRGFITLSRSFNDDLLVEATDHGELSFDKNPSPKSEPGLVMSNKTYVKINTNDRQKRGTNKPSIIMTDQVPGAAIYTRENDGKLEIYHQYTEPETSIALTASNNTAPAFYDTKNGLRIDELADVNVLRLFDRHNNELNMMRGTIKIPDDGLVKYVKNGEFKVLSSINSTPIREIVIKNQQIRRKNAENIRDKLPNFTESCDTCKVIHWEDHLPAGVIDNAYNLNIDRQLKATVVIYKDDKDNWKLSSQLIQYNKEKAGAPEIAEIRPKPKIFDLKLTAKKAEEVKDNQSRKPRNVKFVPEDANVPARNYKFIDNSTQNFNHQTPSVLELGDFWLNSTDFNSNLTLAYAFLKKWTNETLFSTNEGNMPKITDIEFEIFANDLTNDFTENILESAIKCGIPTVMRDILDEINLQKISNQVKRKCKKNLTEEIPKYLMKEILEKNEKKIVGKSSKKQFEKLRKLMAGYLEEFADDLIARNDKLWNGE